MTRTRIPWLLLALTVSGCTPPEGDGELVEVTIPAGASFQEIVDSLDASGLVTRPLAFRTYARLRGDDRQIRSGRYAFRLGVSWSTMLEDLTEGRVVTERLTIPEGFTLTQMAERIAQITKLNPDSVLIQLRDSAQAAEWGVPGPGLEGFLFPDTYRLARGAPLAEVLGAMVARYREAWTPERQARRDSLGMAEGEVVTMASIIQAEARIVEEMPLISSVYHNRLQRGYPLQADPTVLYALGGPRSPLLFASMDSVADHPYNTYTHPGLPPGPIGAPGLDALDAALNPADTDYLYFVARPDGTHIFTRSLSEHNRARGQAREEWDQLRKDEGDPMDPASPG